MMRTSASSAGRDHARDTTDRNHEDSKGAKKAFVVMVMTLRVAVVGVGHLGKHHARLLSALPGVSLVAVVDINRARADEIAAASLTQAAYDARELMGRVDAVTV